MKLFAALAITLYVSTLSLASADECPVKFETDYIEKVATLATNAGSC